MFRQGQSARDRRRKRDGTAGQVLPGPHHTREVETRERHKKISLRSDKKHACLKLAGAGWREGVCVPRCRAPAAARGGWRQLPGTPWDGIERAKRPFRGQGGDALLKRWYREDISEARVSCETRRRSEPGAESGTATCGDGALNPGSNRDMYL